MRAVSEVCQQNLVHPSAHRIRVMGYLGFFYVEAKSFEFRSEISGGVRLAERSRGVFRVVVLGWPSVFWLMQSLEVLIKGDKLSESWRTFRWETQRM